MDLYFAILWLMFTVYFIWRLYMVVKKLDVLNQEISCVVFMLALGVLGLVSWILPVEPSRAVSVVVLIGLLVITTAVSYKLNKKYEAWREEQLENEE